MRGIISRLVLPLVALAALAAVGTAGGASKALPTFVFAGASDPTYLDPALVSDGESFRVTEQVFESLVSLKPGSTLVQSGLATKWGSKNGKDWTFQLRHGVKFHDGTAFNAQAVCYNFNRQYNFTGPFKFKSWTVGEKVELVRNASYWGKKPKLGRVIIRPISNNTARVQALQTGEINGADLIQPQDIPTIKKNKNLKLLNRPSFNVAYVTINQAHAPFNKLAVRQAIAYGLDRASVVKSFYAGRGQVAQEFMPPQLFGWTNKVPKYPYNPAKAKSLLRSAGLSLPVPIEFWYPTNVSRPYMPNPKLNFEAFSASLENSGFKVTAKSAPWRPEYVKHVDDGNVGGIQLIGWH